MNSIKTKRSSFWIFLAGVFLLNVHDAGAQSPEFHTFTNKEGQDIEAKVESVSLVTGEVTIVRRDGQRFVLAGNLFSLDDQAFLQNWYAEKFAPPQGVLRSFGALPQGRELDLSLAKGVANFVEVHAMKDGWIGVRSSGDYLALSERRRDIPNVSNFEAHTVWFLATKKNGTVWRDSRNRIHPDALPKVTKAATGNNHSIAILKDSTVKVWGQKYGGSETYPPPVDLAGIVDIATSQDAAAAINHEGKIYYWKAVDQEVDTAIPGDGAVAVEGGIFAFLALTKSGEVYQWGLNGLNRISIPKELDNEGPFVKIKCNGSTRAAQRRDGSWIAWGNNTSGIVDHINQLGPVIDIAFFSEPGSAEHAYVVWIEEED